MRRLSYWMALAALALPARGQDLGGLGLGAEVDRARVSDVLYVALVEGGVAVVDLSEPASPKVVRRFAEGRRVTKLLVSDGALYLLELRQEVTSYSVADPRHPVVAVVSTAAPRETAAKAELPRPPAKVLEVTSGRVLFDAGAAQGYVPGARVRVTAQRLETKPDLSTGKLVRVPSGESTAVVRIEQAEASRSMARLGRGDVAEPGDIADLTSEPLSQRLFLPRRAPFRVRAGFHARPFLGLDAITSAGASKPFGMLADGYATYYAEEWPIAVSVTLAPVGFALNSAESHYPSTAALTVAYAVDFFEVGLGAGALVGHDGPCFPTPGVPTGCEVNSGATINQVLRLGSLDGLSLTWRSSIFSRPDRFVFGSGRAEANLPIGSHLGLFGAGGGGENGWAFGEFGVRTYLGGTGARGTLIISASLGYASVFDGPNRENVGGPSVAFGMEWRL